MLIAQLSAFRVVPSLAFTMQFSLPLGMNLKENEGLIYGTKEVRQLLHKQKSKRALL